MLATTTCSGEFKINGKQSYGETMVAHKLQACGVHAIGTSLLLLAPLSARLRLALSLDPSLVRCLVAAWFHGQARRLGPTSFVALRLDWVFYVFFCGNEQCKDWRCVRNQVTASLDLPLCQSV